VAQTQHEEALIQLNATQSRVSFMQGMIEHKDQLITRLQTKVDAHNRSAGSPQSPLSPRPGEGGEAAASDADADTAAAAAVAAAGAGEEGNVPRNGCSSQGARTRDEGLVEGASDSVSHSVSTLPATLPASTPATLTPAQRLAKLQGGAAAEHGVGGPLTPSQKLQMLLDQKGTRKGGAAGGAAVSLPPLPGTSLPPLPASNTNGAGGGGEGGFTSPRKSSPRFTYL
jgi:hypothetical protein